MGAGAGGDSQAPCRALPRLLWWLLLGRWVCRGSPIRCACPSHNRSHIGGDTSRHSSSGSSSRSRNSRSLAQRPAGLQAPCAQPQAVLHVQPAALAQAALAAPGRGPAQPALQGAAQGQHARLGLRFWNQEWGVLVAGASVSAPTHTKFARMFTARTQATWLPQTPLLPSILGATP